MCRNKINKLIIAVLVALALSACKTAPKSWDTSMLGDINETLEQAMADDTVMVAQGISAEMLSPISTTPPIEELTLPEPRFDIVARKTPARAVFMSLVENTPYSMVVHPDITGNVTIQLKDVSIEEALETLRSMYGYQYRLEGSRYLILGQGMQTQIFSINYLNFVRKGVSNTHVSSGELSRSSGSGSGSGSGSSSSSSNTLSQSRGIKVETNSEFNFWKDINTSLTTLIGDEDGRRVVINPQAGLAIIRAMPDELNVVAKFLRMTQHSINKQVVLEAKVIEVELNDSFQSGINWASLNNAGEYNILASQVGGGKIFSGTASSSLSGATANLNPGTAYSPLSSASTSAFGGVFSMAIKGQNFAAFVELLKTQGDVKVLSSPRVSTVNNQKAVIKVGGDEFFVTGITNSQVTNGSTTTLSPEVELTPFFSGIALDVTPHIDEEDAITLHIHPAISNVAQRDKNFIVSGQSFTLPLAFSSIQESDNVVRASSGQVIIIGGLMKEASTEENASIPLLGDIPVLGNLFKHKKMTRIKKELVIMLKPTVINNSSAWDSQVKKAYSNTINMQRHNDSQIGRSSP